MEQTIEQRDALLENEREHLLSKDEPLTDDEVTYLFGTYQHYLKALIQYSHPRHNEAMSIRNKRYRDMTPYIEDNDIEERIDLMKDARLADHQNFYG
jgi:hypothetical protein